jgi:hypothetical protein
MIDRCRVPRGRVPHRSRLYLAEAAPHVRQRKGANATVVNPANSPSFLASGTRDTQKPKPSLPSPLRTPLAARAHQECLDCPHTCTVITPTTTLRSCPVPPCRITDAQMQDDKCLASPTPHVSHSSAGSCIHMIAHDGQRTQHRS